METSRAAGRRGPGSLKLIAEQSEAILATPLKYSRRKSLKKSLMIIYGAVYSQDWTPMRCGSPRH